MQAMTTQASSGESKVVDEVFMILLDVNHVLSVDELSHLQDLTESVHTGAEDEEA